MTELVVCGVHTEFCVNTTTRRALALGYPVILVEDGHSTEGNADLSAAQIIRHHNTTRSNISSFGPRVRVIASDELYFEPGDTGRHRALPGLNSATHLPIHLPFHTSSTRASRPQFLR